MSRISCDVTKDLLSGYLDETCSGESKRLVEEHLAECESCRNFLEKLREEDKGKEELKLNYLKRARRFLDIQSTAGIFLPLLMLLAGFYGVNHAMGFQREYFYYLEMPVMMLLCAYALGRGREKSIPSGIQWLVPVAGVILVCAAAVLRYFTFHSVNDFVMTVERMRESGKDDGAAAVCSGLGPFVHRSCLLIALAALVLLIVLVFLAKRKGKVLMVSGNLAWLALNLALTLDEILYSMSELESLRRYMWENGLILAAEFVLVTALLLMLRGTGLMKRVEL